MSIRVCLLMLCVIGGGVYFPEVTAFLEPRRALLHQSPGIVRFGVMLVCFVAGVRLLGFGLREKTQNNAQAAGAVVLGVALVFYALQLLCA